MNILGKANNQNKESLGEGTTSLKKIAIVGNPNVGKSVLFHRLTGSYVIVSNYPGTSVEVTRGKCKIGEDEYEVIDTPGIYSMVPLTEEERVARSILINEKPFIIIHVIDAKNIERMLSFTLQLMEAKSCVILALNMMDELLLTGKKIEIKKLKEKLNIPVIGITATTGAGIDILKGKIEKYSLRLKEKEGMEIADSREELLKSTYRVGRIANLRDPRDFSINVALDRIESLLTSNYNISKKAIAILLLESDEEITELVRKAEEHNYQLICNMVNDTKKKYQYPLDYIITLIRQKEVNEILRGIIEPSENKKPSIREFASQLTMNPISGIPILFLVLYFGLYKFVGSFGAGTVVDFLESIVFEEYFNPFVSRIFTLLIPFATLRDLFVGEYGVITLGLRYAIGIILPIVGIFFIAFSIIEDTGYLPRLAMLIDRLFKSIGLSGRAVIPMVLGFGCDTMATMVTRTLPTKRERIIATMLLALAIPCSAQLGVILGLLGERPLAMVIWACVISLVFLFIGFLTSRILPGEHPSFYMEIPPLRIPKLSNILIKTYSRIVWYVKEILPIFLLASVLIWFGQITGLFNLAIKLLETPVSLIGLPEDGAKIFLFGFFRRDYGAAGLYDLDKSGGLTGVQVVVASIALTLFLPCIAQFLINIKERGIKAGILISIFILIFSFTIAFFVNKILLGFGVLL